MTVELPYGCLWCNFEADTFEEVQEHHFQEHRHEPLPAQ